jgi:Fe-S cluster assembly iron-binding protein IscA
MGRAAGADNRNGSGVGDVLTITQGAEEALAILRQSLDDLPDEGGIRITRETDDDGDQGFAMSVVDSAEDDDIRLDGHALPVFVDPDAADALDDKALDGEAHGDHVHFGFVPAGEEGDFGHGDPSSNGRGPTA